MLGRLIKNSWSTMSLKLILASLAALAAQAAAAPLSELSLVKISEDDPGQWVTEAEKWELFTSKGIGFIDITNIKDRQVLENLSTKPSSRVFTQAAEFPTELNHVEEANELIATANVDGPQEWLNSLAG